MAPEFGYRQRIAASYVVSLAIHTLLVLFFVIVHLAPSTSEEADQSEVISVTRQAAKTTIAARPATKPAPTTEPTLPPVHPPQERRPQPFATAAPPRPRIIPKAIQQLKPKPPAPIAGRHELAHIVKASAPPMASPNPVATPAPIAAPTTAPSAVAQLPPPLTIPTFAPSPTPAPIPTINPTPSATPRPTQAPTAAPSPIPTVAPTAPPTARPTPSPTIAPTVAPTLAPTVAPTATAKPTAAPTAAPTAVPTVAPTQAPSAAPTAAPTRAPTAAPTSVPTQAPIALASPQPRGSPSPSGASATSAPGGGKNPGGGATPGAGASGSPAKPSAAPAAAQTPAPPSATAGESSINVALQKLIPREQPTLAPPKHFDATADLITLIAQIRTDWLAKLLPPADIMARAKYIVRHKRTLVAADDIIYYLEEKRVLGFRMCVGWQVVEHPLNGGKPHMDYTVTSCPPENQREAVPRPAASSSPVASK